MNILLPHYPLWLKPNFSEAVDWITSQEDAEKLKWLFDSFISDMKHTNPDKHPVPTSQLYISSNIPIETSKKHHGCMGYARNKKRKT